MNVFKKAVLLAVPFFLLEGVLINAQEKGEIIISPQSSSKETVKEKKEIQIQEKPKDLQAEDLEKLKSYKRKIYVIYILFFLCLLYLLITYRNTKRRL